MSDQVELALENAMRCLATGEGPVYRTFETPAWSGWACITKSGVRNMKARANGTLDRFAGIVNPMEPVEFYENGWDDMDELLSKEI
jgi:hypothetical protein